MLSQSANRWVKGVANFEIKDQVRNIDNHFYALDSHFYTTATANNLKKKASLPW